jgi:polysaccharide biosynthesis/export protein
MMNRILGCFAVLWLSSVAAGVALAQTPSQIEAFRQLPADQQRQLMEQYRRTPTLIQEQPLEEPETERPPAPTPPVRDADTGLPMFGYDLFDAVPSTFAPVTDIPVPVDFVVGVNDMVSVQLFGKTPGSFMLVVNRDGAINFPELGPIQVAGMTFDEMRRMLQERVSQQMIGVTASITMGELRSIRIFVLGEARQPGSYTVSSLSTITNALFASGGIKPIGSLRNIELKRNGQTVSTLDLYDLLLRGDTSRDVRLQPGDVIFIPQVGTQVGIRGEVLRPAVFELKHERTVDDLVRLGGGLTPEAYLQGAQMSRVSPHQERVLEDLDLRTAEGRGRVLRKGDVVRVPSILERVENVVRLEGHVWREGPVEFRPGMRLTDLIPSIADLRDMPDTNYVLIRRELPPDRRVVGVSADLAEAWRNPGGEADIRLFPRDQVRVFNLSSERPDVAEILDQLRLQANIDEPLPIVRIGGRVRAPGSYPLEPGMRVSDLLRAGGALSESAYIADAEVTRYAVINGEFREIDVINVNIAAIRDGDLSADLLLQPYDFLNVREVTFWRDQETVTLRGEVRFPGTYPIRQGETLLSVLDRAGGLTERAFVHGAVLTRAQLREREAAQIRRLIDRMEADLAALAIQQAQSPEGGGADTIAAGRLLLSDLRAATPVGRLAMDLAQVLAATPGSEGDIILEDGDVLMIPGPMQSVTVIGEVQSPTSIFWERGLSRDDYISLSGGMTRRADASRVYVVRANGQVTASGGRGWFRASDAQLKPGDTIVVPSDIERMRPLPLWTAVTSIIFNLAVAVAAVNSF